ncbi:factor export ATP-binding I [Octopus vulgaris]|uniref:Factor export ATP-binding I n=1 Tax=Octopus vulgaris TaxID=6645 RepID=A0AA36AIB0_OCTVU|nr:factor export ATP-binding I [Octopus vulgaris]
MKPLYQFFTLLKKHILLRRRQPSLLLLEILWPIFVFTIVAIIRSGIPPFKVGKCHYPTRAMPSAGMVPFIQNFACNLNNQCETKDIFKEAHIAEDRLEKMAENLVPIFTAKQSMSSLKTVDKIIDALQNMEGEDIEDILKKGVSIRDLFKDHDAIQEIFVDKLNIFPKDAAEAFLNSKVNLKEILSLTGYIGLKEIACNATLLNSYIIFPQNTNISAVSAAICAINSSMIPNITETVQQHLNMINILKKVSLLMKPYGWSEGLFDLVTMMDTFFNTPTAKSFLKDFKGLGNLTEVIKRLPEWLLHLQKFHEFDFERNEELLNMMEPFLLSTASNETLKSWQLFKSGLNLIERLFGIMSPDMQHSLESIKISLKHLFDNSSHLVGFLSNELNLPRDVVEEIIDKEINVPKFLDFLNLFNETDIEVFLCKKPGLNNILLNSALLINSSSDGFRQQTVQDILCANFTKAHLEFLNKYIDTSSGKVNQKIVHHAISEFQDDIKNIIATFKHLPPEVGKFINAAAYAEIGQIATLLMTFNETSIDDNVDLISEYIVEQTRKYFDNDDEILHSAKNILHFIDNILKYLKGLPSLLEKADMFGKAFETLDSIDPELSKKLLVTFKDPGNMNTVKDISSVINKVFHNIQKRDVKDVNNGIEKELAMNLKSIFNSIEEMQKYNLHTWLYLFSKIQDPKILKLIEESGVLSSLAATMESDPLWKYLGPPMKIIHMSIKKVNEIVSEFEGLNIQFDELLMFQFNYGIELSESMLFLLGNPKVNFILQNASNPEEMMCSEYELLTSWAMSPDIPVESLEAIFCKSNFTRLLLKLSSFAEVYMMFDNIMQSSTPVKLDWNDFVADLKGFFKVASDFIEASNKMMMSGPHSYVEKLMTMLYEEIGKLHSGNHQAEMIIDAATKVALYAQNSPLVSSRVKEQLKLNLIIFDIYLDVVLESAMQKGDPNGISNMFAVAISQLTPFYEGMLKILSYSINYYPHKVLANLLEINGRRICEDLKISNILLFPRDFNQSTITFYENAFCNLNWTVVAEKLSVYPKLEKLSMAISSLYGKTTPQLNLDVTELSMKAKEYIKLPPWGIQDIKDFVQIYHKIFFELTGNLTHMNISNIGKDDSVADLVSMMWKLLYNNTNILPGENTKNMQILFAVIDFIDLNINNMQGKREIYLMDYVNSPEFSKMLKTAKFSKKFIDALFEWLQIFIREPQKMVKFWFDNIEHICDKKLSNTLPPYEMSIHTILCEELFSQTNITKLIQELQMNLPGFNKLINTLNDTTYNNGATTKTDITSLDRLSTSLMVLMQMPPKFHLSSSSSPKEFRNMWSMFMKRVNDELGVNKIDMDKILKRIVPLMEMQMKPLIEKNPQVYYMMMNSADVLLKKLDATLPDVKQGETKLDFEEMFGKNTEMQRMYKNMEELPSVVTSVMFNILTNTESKPIMEVLGSSSVQEMGSKICTSANYQRFATPSCISFDLNKFLRVMCRIDYDTLESEMKNFIPMDRAMQTDIQPLSISPKPPSIYSMLTTVENLWEKMMAMSMVPNSMNMWKPLNLWMNQKPQMDAMMKEFLDMSSDIIDPGSFQYIGYFENMITEIFFRTEEHEHIVMFEEQVLKIVNLNLEKILTGDIKFDMLISENSELYKLIVMMGKSKTFINILTEGIESALGNHHRLVAMLNLANWKNMCNDKSIVLMLFPQANYQEFSEDICGMIYKNINMTALEIQVNEGIPGLKDFLTFLSDMPGANVKINYTAVAVENLKFQRLMSHFIMNFSSIFPKIKQNWSDSMFGNILYGSLLEQWGSIDNVINIVSSTALHQIVKISLSGYGKTPGIIQEFNHQLFVQYHIVEFLNHHLTKINASSSFDLLDYINSTELMKVVKNAEKIPDSVELLPTFFLHMIKNQDNIEKLFDENTWKTICSDKNMFYEIFAPATVSIDDIDEVRKAVCDTLMNGIDTKKLQMQLMGNIAGLKELIDTITSASRNNSDLMPTEFQSFTYEIEHLQELLESLTSKRLDVLIGGDNQWFTEEKYKDIFQKFEKEWNFANTNILKARSMMLENYLTVILNSNISDANLLIIKTNLYQQLAIMKFINTRLEQLTKNGKFDPQMYIDEPLLKALELFEKNSLNIESLFDILLELVRNPLKVKELMKVNDWEDFCKNPGSLSQMFNSSSPKTNITRILKLLCDNELVKLNVPKQILSLISSLDGFEDLLDDFNRSMVVKDPSKLAINVSAVVKEIEHFENLLMLLSLPKELNTTLPDKMEIVYYKMINVLTKKLKEMQNILSADGPFPGYDSIDDILDLGYSSLPFSIKQSLFLQSTSLNRTQIVFKLLVSQIQTIDDSPDILHYIEASAKLLKWFQLIERSPEVTDVVLSLLLDVLKDPHKLKMLQNIETVDSICQNTTGFQILVPSSILNGKTNITALQVIFCDLLMDVRNETQLTYLIEMLKGLPQLIKQLQDVGNMKPDTFLPGKFYIEVAQTSMQLQKVLTSLLHQGISSKLDISLLDKFKTEYLHTLQLFALQWDAISSNYDIDSILDILIEIDETMNHIPKNLLSSVTNFSKELNTNILMQYYTAKFVNIHLKKIKGTDTLVLMDYLKSNEMKKLFGFVEMAPDFLKIFLHSMYRLIQRPDEDLSQNVEGFSIYIHKMHVLLTTNPENIHRTVSYFQIAKEMFLFQNLMDSLMKNPPRFFMSSNNNWLDSKAYGDTFEILQKKLKVLEQDLMNSSTKLEINIMKIIEMVGDMTGIELMPNANIIVEQKIIEFINVNLEVIAASGSFNIFEHINSMEFRKLLGQVEITPEISALVAATGFDIFMNPEMYLPFILDWTHWEKMCNNTTLFQKLFPRFEDKSSIQTACDLILPVNYEILLQELTATLPGFSSLWEMFILLENGTMSEKLSVNYTAYEMSSKKMQSLIESLVMNPPKLIWNVNTNLTLDSFNKYFINITGEDLLQQLANPQIINSYVMQFFSVLSKSTGLPAEINMQAYIEQKVLEFLIANLNPIVASGSFNIFEHINSTEFRKLLGQVEITPEIPGLVAATGFDIFMNPERYLPFILDWTHWENICYNTTLFQKLFPRFEDKSSIQTACNLILPVNYEILLQELNATLPGFSSLWEMFILLENGTMSEKFSVNYTAYEMSSKKMQSLIESLVMNPPKLIWNVNTNLTLDSFNKYFINITGEDLLQQLANPQIINAYVMQFFSVLSKSTGLPAQINMQAYIEQKVSEFLIANLNPIVASGSFNIFEHINSMEFRKLLGQVEITPEISGLVAATGFDIFMNPETFILLKNGTMSEKLSVNYTAYEMSSKKLQSLIASLVMNPPKLIWNVNTNLTLDSFNKYFINITGEDLLQQLANPQIINVYVMQFFSVLSKSTGLPAEINMQAYIEQKVLEFLIANLNPIVASDTFNMLEYIKSSGLSNLLQIKPDMVPQLINATLELLSNPERLLPLMQNETLWEKMCYDTTLFQTFFPSFKDKVSIENLCRLITYGDLQKFLLQINSTLPGFSNIIELMIFLQNHEMNSTIPVDYQGLLASEIQFQTLLTQLIDHPPKFIWGVSMDDFDDAFIGFDGNFVIQYFTTAGLNYLRLMQQIDISKLPTHLRDMVLRERVKDYVMFNLLDFITQNIQALEANQYNLMKYFNSSSELSAFLTLVDKSDTAIELISSTLKSIIISPLKVLPLLDENNWEKICINKTVFRVMFDISHKIPDADLSSLQTTVCSEVFQNVSMKTLMAEIDKTIPGWSNLIAKMSIQLDDPNLKVDVDSVEKTIYFYMQGTSNINNVFDKLKTGFNESGLPNLPSILERIAKEWKELEKDADKLNLQSIFELMKLLNGFNVLTPNTTLGKQLGMINRNLVSAQYLLQFMNIHLKNISESKNFNETSLAQSHQVLKLIGQSGISPDTFAIILNTSLQIFKDPERIFHLIEEDSWINICNFTNTDVFRKMFAIDWSQSISEQQMRFCQDLILQVDMQALQIELFSLEGFKEFYDSITGKSEDSMLDLSLLMSEAMKMQMVLTELSSKPLTWLFGNNENLLNSPKVVSLLNMWKQQLQLVNNGSVTEIYLVLPYLSPFIKQVNTMPEWKNLMSELVLYLQTLDKMLYQLSHFGQNISALLIDKPELQKSLQILLKSPEMLSSVVYNMALNEPQITKALMSIAGSQDPAASICQAMSTVKMASIPNSDFDLNSYILSICSIDFTNLKLEFLQLSSVLNKRDASSTEILDPIYLLNLVKSVWEKLSVLTKSNETNFWEPLNNLLQNLILQSSLYDENTPELENIYKIISQIYHSIPTFTNHSQSPVQSIFTMLLTMNATSINEMYTKYFGDVWKEQSLEKSVLKVLESFFEDYFDGAMNPLIRELLKQKNVSFSDADIKDVIGLLWGQPYTNESISLPPPAFKIWQTVLSALSNLTRDGKFVISNGNKSILQQHLMDMLATVQNQFQYTDMRKFTMLLSKAYNISDKTVALLLNNTDVLSKILMMDSNLKEHCYNGTFNKFLTKEASKYNNIPKEILSIINSTFCSNFDFYSALVKLYDSQYLEEKINSFFSNQSGEDFMRKIILDQVKILQEIIPNLSGLGSNTFVNEIMSSFNASSNSFGYTLMKMLSDILPITTDTIGVDTSNTTEMWKVTLDQLLVQSSSTQLIFRSFFQTGDLDMDSVVAELFKKLAMLFNIPSEMQLQPEIAYVQHVVRNLNNGNAMSSILNETHISHICHQITSMPSDSQISKNIGTYIFMIEMALEIFNYQNKNFSEIENIICDSSDKVVVNVIDLLQKSGFLNLFYKVRSMMFKNGNETIDCNHLSKLASSFPEQFYKQIHSLDSPNKAVKCLRRRIPKFMQFINHMDLMLTITAEMLDLVQDPLFESIVNNKQLSKFIAVILNSILEQRTVIVKLSQLFLDPKQAEMYLLNKTTLSPDIIKTLFDSRINMKLVELIRKSPQDMQDLICTHRNLSFYIDWPNSKVSLENVTEILCKTNLTATITGLVDYLDSVTIIQELSLLNQSFHIELPWLMNVSREMADLLENVHRLLALEDFLSSFDFNQLSRLIPNIQQLVIDQVPQKIVSSILHILDDFKRVQNTSFSQEFIEDIEITMKGILGLEAVDRIMALSAVFRNFLKSPDVVRDYLMNNLNLPHEISDALINSTVSLAQFINFRSNSVKELMCKNISRIITLSNNTNVTYQEISNHLCHLNTKTIYNLTQLIMEQLNIGEFVKQYVLLRASTLLKSTNITVPIAKETFSQMSRTSALVRGVGTAFNDNEIYKVFSNFDSSEGDLSKLKELVPLMCGRNASLMLDAEGGLSIFSSANEIKGKDGLSKSQRREYNSLPNEFCKQLYKGILKSSMGEITWKFLKPLIRGQILYTPKNKVTNTIIGKMEKFFAFIGQLQEMSQEWATGLEDVSAIRAKLQNLTDIMKYTETEFFKDMFHDMFDVDKSTLIDSIHMLNSMDDKTLGNLRLLLTNVVNYSSCLSKERFKSVSFDELQKEALNLSKSNEFLAAIIFLDTEEMEDEENRRSKRETKPKIPKHIKYEIRMNIDYVPMTRNLREQYWRPRPEDNLATEMKYLQGFIQLQDMIDKAIIESHMEEFGANVSIPGVHLKQFPYPCHMKDEYLHIVSSYLLPIMMTLAWLASLGLGIRNIVQDRAEGQEEALRVMGMYGIISWLAWMISTMIIMALVCIVVIFILHFSTIFIFSNILLMFLYFLTFCFSTVMMCYMVSSFFSNTTLAVLTGLIFYLLSYIPYIVLQSLKLELSFYQVLLVCLSSTTAFSFGSQYLSRYEEQMVGLQWKNIHESPMEGDELSFSFACTMMAIDSLIYFIIGWYVKSIMKKKYGIPKPWYFPFYPKYWGLEGANSLKHYSSSTIAPDTFYSSDVLYENRSAKGPVGISLMNLSKRYGTETAVQNLSLKFHKGEITTILGQNGAGKTTTFNMLTGLMESTTGIVAFYDSEKGKNNSWLGICPQQNILFEYMTTEEHIRFYISIKTGWQGKKLEREVRSILKDVDLLHMRNTPAKQLSGGMQRRLCVALAFAGKSSIVVLDEPTAGVDPSARRSIWDLILKYKNDRTVIMSTHHLDEADILSDRVAILHKGKLLCCGSTLFLKRHLGKGYCLSLVKNTPPLSGSANSLTASDSFDAQKTLDFISKYIPGPEISENFSEEATILLPADEKIRGNFSAFFEDFDDNLNKLGIKNYGISDTTLEEVFLQARELSNAGLPMTPENMKSTLLDDTKMSARSESHQSLESRDINEFNSALDISSKVSYESNNFTAFLTLIQKRASHYRRNWKMAISVILLPCIFFAMAVGFSKIAPKNDYKRLRLSPALYGPNSYMFYKDKVGDLYGKDLLKWISHSPGVGTTCMSDTASNLEEPFECKPAETVFKRPKYQKDLMNKTEKCECENFRFKCSKYASGIPPTQLQLNSTDFLQNLNSKSMPVSEYLLESYMNFRKKRYGGWTYERNSNNKDKKQVTVWFNNKGHHSMPAFLNGYSNAILRTEVARNKFGNPEEYGISAFNNPIQLSVSTLNEESILFHASETAISLIILLAISFIPAAFSIYLVKENISSEKYLFIISGVKTPIYWMSAFIWDLIVYCLSLIIIVIILAIFKLDSFWIRDNFSATILLIFLFGWASIPLMYTTVSFFKDPTTSYMIVFCFNIFSGLCTSVCVFLLSLFQGTQALQNAYQICRYVFLIFPQFSLSYGLVSLGNNQLQTSIFAHFGMDVYKNPFEMLHWHIISLFICGIVFFLITLFLETRNYCTRRDKTIHSSIMKEDEDVQHERMRVEKNIEKQENSISILRLTKMYRQGLERILAVNQISLGIKEGECFGLLGVNGAGKTTTFKILTGQLSASSGDVFIKDESLSKNKRNARKLMGYCPQEDALDYFLTGRELLWYHARIRGIPKSEINAILCQLINTLNLENCANKLIGTYSGGMKRKLSFAIALLGEPPIVLLDEPTAGMDPAAKRLVWNCILKATSKGQSVVLTSHSMQECDVLCNRLCIMVNGQFKCIGSPQHLKNKFSKGYSLSINLKEILSDSSNLDKYVFENFPGSEKKDSHNTTLQYSIPKNTSKVANIFEVLEKGKNLFAIQDYAVSQTTLDMVFLGFTKEQTDGFVDEIDEEDYPAYAYDHKAFSLEPEMLYSDPKLKYTQTSNL